MRNWSGRLTPTTNANGGAQGFDRAKFLEGRETNFHVLGESKNREAVTHGNDCTAMPRSALRRNGSPQTPEVTSSFDVIVAQVSNAPTSEVHVTVAPEANLPGLPLIAEDSLARRRFQRGSVYERGKRERVWVARWREDCIGPDNQVHRVSRKEVLGSKRDFPTKKLALRELEVRLAPINSGNYRALRTSNFAQFLPIWERDVVSQFKPST